MPSDFRAYCDQIQSLPPRGGFFFGVFQSQRSVIAFFGGSLSVAVCCSVLQYVAMCGELPVDQLDIMIIFSFMVALRERIR